MVYLILWFAKYYVKQVLFFFFFLLKPWLLTSSREQCTDGTHKLHFLVIFLLKMGLIVLFTHLKIILLQYFQFSIVSKPTLNIFYMSIFKYMIKNLFIILFMKHQLHHIHC